MSHRLSIFHSIVDGLCDLIARCTLVRINHLTYHLFHFYSLKSSKDIPLLDRKNIGVVILPLLLEITFLSQSIYLHLIKPISIYRL
jgi:hypothetical protein